LMLASGAACDACLTGRRAVPALLAAALTIGGALVFGALRVQSIETSESTARTLHVGVVQANLAYSENLREPGVGARRLKLLQEESQKLSQSGVELILWSEVAYPYPLPRSLARDFGEGDPMRVRRGFDTPLLFGAAAVDTLQGAARYTNSAYFLDAAGKAQAPYDKNELVPFGEQVPFDTQIPWLRSLRLKAAGAFSEGQDVTTFSVQSNNGVLRVAPMICLEDTLPEHTRRLAERKPDLLVSLSNDAWFGATREPMQHLALSVFRSVELRAPMVRATHNGPSALISATGRVLAHTSRAASDLENRLPERLDGKVALSSHGSTVFARVGSVFSQVCAVLLLLGLAVCLQRRLAPRRVGEPGR